MSGSNPRYARLILPLATGRTFTYSIPPDLESAVTPGKRVTVNFGRGRKIHTAVIHSLTDSPVSGVRTKPILGIVDERPVVTESQIAFWMKMADHYLCSPGEVMLAAMPAQLLLDSETRILPLPYHENRNELPSIEQTVLGILDQRQVMSLEEVGGILEVKAPFNKVRKWVDMNLVVLEEKTIDRFVSRKKTVISLPSDHRSDVALNRIFDDLKRAPAQTALLMSFIQLADPLASESSDVERKRLLKAAESNSSVLKQLLDKGILEENLQEEIPVATDQDEFRLPPLSNAQQTAFDRITSQFKEKGICLLHGVTSSGKTEIYLRLIKEIIAQGKQVLYLLPEIALTTQMIRRVQSRMGEGVHVYHSRITQRERARTWTDMIDHPDKVNLVVAARSGLFLPFKDLGAIVVDEEHDPSYKQQDPAPRYNARDMAIMMGHTKGIPVLLGSATPALESMFNAEHGKYGSAQLTERYGKINLPIIRTADIKEARKKNRMQGHFTPELLEAITLRLAKKEQVILFQNRRGYTPVWQCTDCGWVPECDHCDVSLTYHKREHGLRCHYCGRSYEPVLSCKACGSKKLKMIGFGTELLEEELTGLFPDARVARLDQDTARGKKSFGRIMADLEDGTIDILVGTQMVTKGLDLDHVTLVGIMNADALIGFPDFRASERAFQLMAQVAGRAGRRNAQGEVIIQTYDPFQEVIRLVKENNVEQLYQNELVERKRYFYPPFSRLVRITLKHRDQTKVNACAHSLAVLLNDHFGQRALGPETPYIARIRDMHIRNILIKLSRKDYGNEKVTVRQAIEEVLSKDRFRTVRPVVDVDPL